MKQPKFTIVIKGRRPGKLTVQGTCKPSTPAKFHLVAGEILTQALQRIDLSDATSIKSIEFCLHT